MVLTNRSRCALIAGKDARAPITRSLPLTVLTSRRRGYLHLLYSQFRQKITATLRALAGVSNHAALRGRTSFAILAESSFATLKS